ncbi:MAG TPA: hypothetical protein VK074_08625, partial [Fodinibius sp.]|nr:hypothetical protein [Fodinibius sp.]
MERWTHDSQVDRSLNYSELVSRGVSLWINSDAESENGCQARIFLGTINAQLIALDARTGEPCREFGDDGHADLKPGHGVGDNISADPERGLVFVPTGSPSPDFYGGLRPGSNKHANSVVALRASTGKVMWAFQMVHRDLWDYDTAAQPALVTVTHNGRS